MALEQARQSQAPRRPLNPLAPAYVPLSHIQPETQHSSQRRRQQATGGESQQNIVAQVSENSTPTVTGLLDFNVSRDNQTGNLQIHLGTRTHEVTSDEVDSWWADWYTNQGVGSGPLSRMRLYDFLAAEERSVTDALTSTPSIPNMADAATLGQASGVRKRRRTSLAGSQRYEGESSCIVQGITRSPLAYADPVVQRRRTMGFANLGVQDLFYLRYGNPWMIPL